MNRLNSLFEQQLTGIIEEVNRQAKCEFVQRYVDIPPIPWIRMQVLFLFLHQSGVEIEKIKKYLVSTLLIQIGLDCHEEVTLLKLDTEKEIRTRQLSVLAGDFYSSKYYYLLAHMEDIELIRGLARSIYDINVAKTLLYTTAGQDAEGALRLRNQIDSALYVSFIPRFDRGSERVDWLVMMQQFILVERLMDELLSYRMARVAKGHMQMLSTLGSLEDACERLQMKLDSLLDSIALTVDCLEGDGVKGELQLMLDDCRRKASKELQV